ncbi:MAG: transposase [bacterium]|nr:transposase [bacterium]
MRKIKFTKGGIYHIFNRGVEKRNIFQDNADRWRFIQGLYLFNDKGNSANLLWKLENEKGGLNFRTLKYFMEREHKEWEPLVRIMADCLMPNHYHLILEEIRENGISNFMHKIRTGYTGYFNKKHERVGSLFQGTFKAIPVDKDLYLQYLLIYLNVVNPGELVEPKLKENAIKNIDSIIKFAENYPWSTHQEYLGKRNSIIIDRGVLGNFFSEPMKYQEFTKDILLTKKFNVASHFFLE